MNGTFSTGINIKNIHNIVFASNYKSKTKVIQSIGRGLRTHDSKMSVKVWDIVDDLVYEYFEGKTKKKYTNYSIVHHKERISFYTEEGYDDHELYELNI